MSAYMFVPTTVAVGFAAVFRVVGVEVLLRLSPFREVGVLPDCNALNATSALFGYTRYMSCDYTIYSPGIWSNYI